MTRGHPLTIFRASGPPAYGERPSPGGRRQGADGLQRLALLFFGLLGAKTGHAAHIQNHRMMDDSVDRGQRGQRIFENLVPGRKDEVGGYYDRAVFVAFGKSK
jgi:hypothetical protein